MYERVPPADKVVILVNNFGKTPANLHEIAVSVSPEDQLPKASDLPADYERSKRLVDLYIAPGTTRLPTKLTFELRETAGKIVYGRCYYTDIFGAPHSSGFIVKVLSSDTTPFEAAPEYTAWD